MAECRLKHVASINYGLGQPPPLSVDGIPIIRATDINRGKIVDNGGILRAKLSDLPLGRTPLLLAGEILVVRSGANTGDSAIIPPKWSGCSPGYDLRVTPHDVEPRFLAYCLLGNSVLDQIKLASTRAAQPHLNAEELGDIRVPTAGRDEQRRIADFLDAETSRIDRLTNLRQIQIAKLSERYISAVSELVTPGICSSNPKSDRWPWLSGETAVARLGYMAQVQSGITVHAGRAGTDRDVEHPYLRVANVQGEHIDLSEVKTIVVPREMAASALLQKGDVVMTEANGNPDNLGRGAVWDGQIDNMVHQNHVFAIRVDRTRLLPEFLTALLASIHGRRYFRFTSTQVGIATTSSAKVLDFPIPVVDVAEQESIIFQYQRIRETHTRTTSLLERQKSLFAERRQALIAAAVTGQFDVSTASGRNTTQGV